MGQDVYVRDPTSGIYTRVGEFGDLRITPKLVLKSDDFETTTIDTGKWIENHGGGGTVTQANGEATFATGTTSTAQATWDSQLRYAPLIGTELVARFGVRFGTVPIASNRREFGIRDDAETTFVVAAQDGVGTFQFEIKDAANTVIAANISTVNPANLDNFILDIGYSKTYVRFLINGAEMWRKSLIGMTAHLLHANAYRQFIKNKNSGSTTDSTLVLTEVGMYLVGDSLSSAAVQAFDQNALSDSLKMRGPGFLSGVLRQGTSQTFIIRDGTTASGRSMIDSEKLGAGYTPCNMYFADGMYFDHAGGLGADHVSMLVRG